MKNIFCLLMLFTSCVLKAQYYFPPTTGNTWDTVSPQSLGWCTDRMDSLYDLLDRKNTKAFIILKDGKIAVEKYFDTFTKDSAWGWNSAGKSLVSFLVGLAQEQQLLNIEDTTSKYLGTGWTSCPPEKEGLITIRHQLTMTTGLEYNVPDDDCTTASCLTYKADAGSFWYYYNAPYRLLQPVVAAASGQTFQQYTNQQLTGRTGINGLWYNSVFYSKPRNMARFGLLMLNKGIWNTDTIMRDTGYYRDMINTSQGYNQSYGYLWWLNGKSSFKLPGSVFTFPGDICPPAPDEMYAALGKDDQKLYVWPSKGIVVVRMGEAADGTNPVPIIFDSTLWNELNRLFCYNATGLVPIHPDKAYTGFSVYPNPAVDHISITGEWWEGNETLKLHNAAGQLIAEKNVEGNAAITFDISNLPPGLYSITEIGKHLVMTQKVCIIR
jgi:CubicO group peptidase (beta-lactamase class C family)